MLERTISGRGANVRNLDAAEIIDADRRQARDRIHDLCREAPRSGSSGDAQSRAVGVCDLHGGTTDRDRLANGQTYKGQDTLALRSDGNFLGLLVAPILDLPRSRIQLEAPVAIGQGVYGFYLSGDDRVTPDGRRVSKWEDELQSGKDSGFAFGIDAGLRVGYKVAPWLRVVVGAHYTKLFGYEAFVTEDYSGPSASLGVELGAFE
jgi:hypothetical protein